MARFTKKHLCDIMAKQHNVYEAQIQTFERAAELASSPEMQAEYKELKYGALMGRATLASLALDLEISEEYGAAKHTRAGTEA